MGEWGPKGRLKEEGRNHMTHYFSGWGGGVGAKCQLKEKRRNNMSHYFPGRGLREWGSKGQLEEEG